MAPPSALESEAVKFKVYQLW